MRKGCLEVGAGGRTRGAQLAGFDFTARARQSLTAGGGGRVNKYSMCDMNMEEGKVYMSAPWSKLALSLLLKAENECAGSRVQPAADRAKCVMR